MRSLYLVAVAAIAAQASAVTNSTSKGALNGWYACYDYTFSDEEPSPGQDAECATYSAPLCYPGICETPDNVDSTKVEIFVKRLLATSGNPDSASNVWLMQGGPGAGSTQMESSMVDLHQRLEGAVNVYTMDHRGTGRSTLFNCVAAQATTTGTPWGDDLIAAEVPTCARDLQFKYGEFASFSVTSAATDLKTFISKYTNAEDTTTSWSPDTVMYMSDWDKTFGEIGDDFFALCDEDKGCKTHFATKKLNDTVQGLLEGFDKDPNSTCATIIKKSASCKEFNLPNYDANPIMYKRDEYWNKSATIPSHASVLLLSGKLDPQTHHKYADALLLALNGKNKELISFDYAPHGMISSTQMTAGDPSSPTCGVKLLESYVRNGGVLAKMGKSCVAQMPGFNLTVPLGYLHGLLGTDDAYEGVLKSRAQ
ncbi:Serine protease [Phytophthora megakarya]|uniref:Serine protease n=1 Tax=Phytophthora megakarya TaxID=4795 RepID=A0A225VVC0_9STRA|nr:Serine protease [Phytophthora megakarya]